MKKILLAGVLALFTTSASAGELIGSVDTSWRMIGPNDRVTVERFDDPRVENASCYVSRAVKGGVTGAVGLAEDRSRFSIACRATGPVRIRGDISKQEDVFNAKTSILFKELHVTRMYDSVKNVIVYLVWSDKLIDGSPFNSVTAIRVE